MASERRVIAIDPRFGTLLTRDLNLSVNSVYRLRATGWSDNQNKYHDFQY
jgi:hypothetical protein